LSASATPIAPFFTWRDTSISACWIASDGGLAPIASM
jgi:hypothetical protein